MLFCSIVFMCRTLQTHSVILFIVYFVNLVVTISAQTQRDKVVKFSGDFETFLKDLGSMVYKSKKRSNHERTTHERTTIPPQRDHRRSETQYNTQKSALGDVLMMKLVSYYEDKYKLTHHESTTTEGITFRRKFTQHYVNKYNEVDRSDSRLSTNDRNGGFGGQHNRRNYNEPPVVLPEVVIL